MDKIGASRLGQWRAQWRRRVFDPAVIGTRRRVTAMLALVVVLSVVQVWVRLKVRDLGYRVQRTNLLIEKLDFEHAELFAEFSHEKTPAQLGERARATLGLKVPEAGQVVTLYGPEP